MHLSVSSSLLALALTCLTVMARPQAIRPPHVGDVPQQPRPTTVLVGSYSGHIYSLSFQPPTARGKTDGTLKIGPSYPVASGPSWVTRHSTIDNMLYCVDEFKDEVLALRLGDDEQSLEVVGKVATGGGAPAHVVILQDGSAAVTANYNGGSITVVPLDASGFFPVDFQPSPIIFPFNNTSLLRDVNRQDASHPHQIVEVQTAEGGVSVWVPDLGADTVWQVAINNTGGVVSGKLDQGVPISGDEGGGIRHMIVGANGTQVYLTNEMKPRLSHVTFSGSASTLVSQTSIVPPTLASPIPQNTTASGAELLLLPNNTLVASIRTLPDRPVDSLAFFNIDEETGAVELEDFVFPRKGREFRGVGASADGEYIMVVGQTDGWVSVFGKGWDGKWAEVVDQQVQLVDGKPTGVLFL